ncbi:MAG: enoyl-CoA hydratase/isomerase family protein [Gammaproteobacteria bacterium]|uniref:enoyl-CoA hydratase-related protein n=1 Tax=Pseudomaricurvus alcaniphilus TaxID=1166482 RepID=UPI001409437C|nr:enoyl-CoA hydratase/isomerase family protein [Gammaproteobacteria bacterium]NHN39001.1 enoyl-CoA hydratase/isomerase family protein [Pseudomaricurvus alcaniphilus]
MTTTDSAAEVLIGSGPVLLSINAEGIGELTLNTPETANCLNNEMLIAMSEALMICHGEPRLRVLILKGAGKNFCAGGDIKTFVAKGDQLPYYIRQATLHLQAVVNSMIRLQVPVIASVQGFAAGGGGFGFVCAVDVVIAADSANFLAGATRVGMSPDAGLSVTLQNLVGFRQAMHILLTNPVISAPQALELGILTQVVAADELALKTREYAEGLAQGAPLALGQTKRLLWNGMGAAVETGFDDESRTVASLAGTRDSMEAMRAILEKREASFTGQ